LAKKIERINGKVDETEFLLAVQKMQYCSPDRCILGLPQSLQTKGVTKSWKDMFEPGTKPPDVFLSGLRQIILPHPPLAFAS